MFTINLEDGREAPSKARKKGAKRLEFLVYLITLNFKKKFDFKISVGKVMVFLKQLFLLLTKAVVFLYS